MEFYTLRHKNGNYASLNGEGCDDSEDDCCSPSVYYSLEFVSEDRMTNMWLTNKENAEHVAEHNFQLLFMCTDAANPSHKVEDRSLLEVVKVNFTPCN